MRKRCVCTFFSLGILLIGLMSVGAAQQLRGLAEVATGEGTLTLDNRKSLRIKAVAVFLRENGKAEICLMTEKENVYAGGRWFRGAFERHEIELQITDDTQGGCATGCGTVLLQEGCVPIASLTMTVSRMDGTTFEVEFTEKNARPCPRA